MRDFEVVRQTVRQRQTWKVLADPLTPVALPEDTRLADDAVVRSAVADAGWAPFHYDRNRDGIAEPWRAYMMEAPTCRKIAANFFDWFEDVKPNNKIPSMLAACGCVVLINWIPQFRGTSPVVDDVPPEKQMVVDDEHLAASAAMVQNLLLILTSHGLGTYWSSGGQLGGEAMFRRLGIPPDEKLLAAVFVEYPGGHGAPTERIAGKQRDRRSEVGRWFQTLHLA